MDDFLILTKTQHKLRECVRYLNSSLSVRGFEKHKDKTFIGKISRGFDWLSVDFDNSRIIGVSLRTIKKTSRNMP